MGYLFCEKCGGYYELQKGENLDDFAECECGGKLTFSLRLDSFKDSDNYKNMGKYNRESIESYKKLKTTISNYKNEKRRKYLNKDNLSLKALLVGFLIGLIPVPFITSLIGGFLAGLIAGGSYKRGALHGITVGIISLSTPIFILSNPIVSGSNFWISLFIVCIIVSVIPALLMSLFGIAAKKAMDRRSSQLYKPPYISRFKWWNDRGSNGQAVLIIAAYFIFLSLFIPFTNFNDLNYFSGNVSGSLQSSTTAIDEQLKVEALQLIQADGYWSKYNKKLKNGQVKSSLDGIWLGNVEIDRDSVKISSINNGSFVVQYRAVHHARDFNEDVYYDAIYLYSEKAVKKDGGWQLQGNTSDPQFIKEESYKRWYSASENVWYREKINQ